MVRLGQPVRVVTEPGLHFKMPLIDSVIYVDKRILDLENPAQEVIASDQKRLVVDAFARYRINDPLQFYQTVGIDRGRQLAALDPAQLGAAPRARRGDARPTSCATSAPQLMARVREQLDREAQPFGISVVDVRIRRADLPEQNSQAVYQRMQTERQREAAEFRAQGSQQAQEIRAKADRDVTVLVAEATSKAEQTRGEGDAERNRIFAEAFGKDPDFFTFYRSMQAYEAGLQHNDTAWCSRRIRSSSATSAIRSASARRRPAPTAAPTAAGDRACRRRRVRAESAAADSAAPSGPGGPCPTFSSRSASCFAIEGLLFAAFPGGGQARHGGSAGDAGRGRCASSASRRRVVGVLLVWLVRG